MTPRAVYLDYNATTPMDPRVFQAMEPYLKEQFGNPSSVSHPYGWTAKAAVDAARKKVATLLGVKSKAVIWTSGATEGNNMALFGILRPYLKRKDPCHLITSQVEHKAILDVAQALEEEGVEVTYVKPTKEGFVTVEAIAAALKPHTRMVSVIMGQNEIGTINPIAQIGEMLAEQSAKTGKIYFHSDSAQTVGKIEINMPAMKLDVLSGSGHKIYGPKGVGFIAMHEGNSTIELEPLFYGGAQEGGLRPGTLNVPGIVGMGEACAIAQAEMQIEHSRLTELRDNFIQKLLKNVPEAILNGPRDNRLSNNINVSFRGLSADLFSLGLSGLAVSSASACSGGAPSHILHAIGLDEALSRATVRIGIGRFTELSDLDLAYNKIIQMIEKNRKISAI